MFLGYSILQLLEYGVAVMTTSTKRFYDYLHGRMDQERQVVSQQNGDTQNDVVNITYHHQEINVDQGGMATHLADLKQEIIAIKQEMKEEGVAIKQEMAEIKKTVWTDMRIKEKLANERKYYNLR